MRRLVMVAACIAPWVCGTDALRAQDTTKAKPPAGAPAPGAPPAQDAAPVGPTVGPPIQKIATASALSTEPLGAISSVRELPNGNVLLNDGTRRRLLLMDTTLKTVSVVLDSFTNSANSYGIRAGSLLPYPGDSTLFVDQASLAMLVIDPNGKFTRVRSVWRIQDLQFIANPQFYGYPGFDAKRRIVYKIPAQVSPAVMSAAMSSDVPFFPSPPDSAFLVAFNLETRKLDTLGAVRTPKQEMRARKTPEGWYTMDQVVNPLPRTDDWAVLSDSRIAFVRGLDYRIDYLNPDGTWTSSEKLPYDWQRLDDAAKKKFVDSVKVMREGAALNDFAAQTIRWVNMFNGKYPANFKVPANFVMPPGFPKDWFLPTGVKFPDNYQYACAPGQAPATPGPSAAPPAGAPPGAPGAGAPGAAPAPLPCLPAPVMMTGGFTPPPPSMRPVIMVDPQDLPDYRPPMTSGAVRADEDGNLWIRFVQQKTIPGGPVYDIVDSKGVLTTRIQLPSGYTLVGFGKGKIVYLSMRDAQGIHLARVRLK